MSHERAAAAPAARGTETGRCSQDKESTAWFVAAHSGREYFKLNKYNSSVSYGCFCLILLKLLRSGLTVIFYFTFLFLPFSPDKLLKYY